MIKFPFDEVSGLLSGQDKVDLKRMSGYCAVLPGNYVEIGSMHGLSTLCICAGMPWHKLLIAFDYNHQTNDIAKNLKLADFTERVELVTGNFADTFTERMALSEIAFAFVDHDHTLANTKLAYELLWPRLVPGSILAFHDYQHHLYLEASNFLGEIPHPTYIKRDGLIAFTK
jgi:predicted O-methyltransferase YrrM